MTGFVFDIETNGLEDFRHLTDLREIHCIVAKDLETGEILRANSQNGMIETALRSLAGADLLVGQNIIGFDIPAIQKLHPWFKPRGVIRDTKVCTQLIWPVDVLKPKDFALAQRGKLPKNLIGKYSLEAWGHRIGEYKTKANSFDQWSQDLEDYCVQDVEVTAKLWALICAKNYSPVAVRIEHAVATIILEQERTGFPFDEAAAQTLYAELVQRRLDLERELQGVFKPWYAPGKLFTPKRDNKKMRYVAGAEMQHISLTTFNPGSRDHIADRFIKLYGWKPEAYGEDGKPTVDETIISKLPYPEAPLLSKYLLVQKRIGQLAEGKEALLKHVRNGRIHGGMTTNGTVTGRGTHHKPNLGQVPKVQKRKDKTLKLGEAGGWGYEFRSLFIAPPGWVLVGADASGLELRMLGHYMARWDGGAYAREVVEGDVHAITLDALSPFGCDSRDTAKTWNYAWLYGAGDEKLGKILKKLKGIGAKSRVAFLSKLPALKHLIDAVKHRHQTQKYLKGLDDRIVHTRSDHSALNTLLQSAGAIVCKLWLALMHRAFTEAGYVHGRDYAQVVWVHDEVQILARPEIADEIGKLAVAAVTQAGEDFGLKVPLAGEFKVGRTWAETH